MLVCDVSMLFCANNGKSPYPTNDLSASHPKSTTLMCAQIKRLIICMDHSCPGSTCRSARLTCFVNYSHAEKYTKFLLCSLISPPLSIFIKQKKCSPPPNFLDTFACRAVLSFIVPLPPDNELLFNTSTTNCLTNSCTKCSARASKQLHWQVYPCSGA